MRLQTRIALAAAAVVLGAVALFAVGAYLLISERAYDRLDRSLNETADQVTRELSGPDLGGRDFTEPPTPSAPVQPSQSADPDAAGTRVELDPSGTTAPSGPRTVVLDGERYRLLVRALETGADGGAAPSPWPAPSPTSSRPSTRSRSASVSPRWWPRSWPPGSRW